MKTARTKLLARLALVASISAGLAACGGSSNNSGDGDSGGPSLEERQEAQQGAITKAAGDVRKYTGNLGTPPTNSELEALKTAIEELDKAIEDAKDLSEDARALASGQLGYAQGQYATAKAAFDDAAKAALASEQKMAIAAALVEVMKARGALNRMTAPSRENIDDLIRDIKAANKALDDAIMAADDVPADDAELVAAKGELDESQNEATMKEDKFEEALTDRRKTQLDAIEKALAFITVATDNLSGEGVKATQPLVAALDNAVTMLETALGEAVDWTVEEKSGFRSELNTAKSKLVTARDEVSRGNAADMAAKRDAIGTASSAVETARGALSTPPTSNEIAALETAIAGLESAISDAEGVLDATELAAHRALVSSAKSVQASAQEAYDDDKFDKELAEQKKLNDAALEVAEAINAHKTAGNPPNAFGTALPITRTSSGPAKGTINQPTPDSDKYDVGAVGRLSGFSSHSYSRDSELRGRDVEEIAVVYTDIESAGSAAWNEDSVRVFITGATVAVSNVVTIPTGSELDADRVTGSKIVPQKPSGDEGRFLELAAGAGASGSLFGENGRFTCDGSKCTITRVDNTLTLTGGSLRFDPDASKPMVAYGKPDADYTYFGYWMESTELRDDATAHDIETFHGGAGATISDISGVTGSATYFGAAAGKYVKKEGDVANDDFKVTQGMFTADAMLEAHFGGNDIAVSDQFSLSGAISDFMDAAGNDLGFDDLMLEEAKFAQTGSEAGEIGSGVTKGGGPNGEWMGKLYGNANPGDDNDNGDGPDAMNDYPANVSGEFNGHFTNGHVAGAFGAAYDE